MAFTIRKKSPIFSVPSYLPAKKKKTNNTVDELIKSVIQEKIFNLLNINRRASIKLIEYFISYTFCSVSREKSVASFNLRIRNRVDKRFKTILAQEIELSGVTALEFDNYLKYYNSKEIKEIEDILAKI
tara:strand:+ start:454 stop:840 length:387 start_codon:yes stop_codon:yes gene_type:complete